MCSTRSIRAKLNATLTALAEGVRGQGERIGEATTGANQVLLAVNPRMGTVGQNWHSLTGFSDAYSAAAQDILATLERGQHHECHDHRSRVGPGCVVAQHHWVRHRRAST